MRTGIITKTSFIKSFLPIKKDEIIREFIDKIVDCVIFVSTNYYINWVNREANNVLRYEPDELKGKSLKYILGKEFFSAWDDFRNLMGQVPVRDYEAVLKKKDNSEIPVRMNIIPFRDTEGTTTGWLIMAKDITETRDRITELVNLHKSMENTVHELEHSRDELIHAEKLSFAGRIAASVAHEIRNPLNIISMAIQQLHNELARNDSHKEYTKMIIDNINRVNRLLTEFVDMTRPPKLKMRLEDINFILEEVIGLIHPKIQERKINLIKSLDKDLPRVKIDRDHIIQALSNLLINSCEAIPKRGGNLWITSKRAANLLTITIKNTGKPIPKKDLIKIGEPFFTKKKEGTGLGMSIAYSIIGSHRGTISVESSRKLGTIFNISLPLEK